MHLSKESLSGQEFGIRWAFLALQKNQGGGVEGCTRRRRLRTDEHTRGAQELCCRAFLVASLTVVRCSPTCRGLHGVTGADGREDKALPSKDSKSARKQRRHQTLHASPLNSPSGHECLNPNYNSTEHPFGPTRRLPTPALLFGSPPPPAQAPEAQHPARRASTRSHSSARPRREARHKPRHESKAQETGRRRNPVCFRWTLAPS